MLIWLFGNKSIGHGLRRADDGRVAAAGGEQPQQFAHGGPRGVDDAQHGGVTPLRAGELLQRRQRRHGGVELAVRGVLADEEGELAQGVRDREPGVESGRCPAGLRLRRGHMRDEPRHHRDRLRVAASRGGPGTDVRAVGVRGLEVPGHRVDPLGVAGGELAARLGGPGLEQDRAALRRRRHVQRPGDLEGAP